MRNDDVSYIEFTKLSQSVEVLVLSFKYNSLVNQYIVKNVRYFDERSKSVEEVCRAKSCVT